PGRAFTPSGVPDVDPDATAHVVERDAHVSGATGGLRERPRGREMVWRLLAHAFGPSPRRQAVEQQIGARVKRRPDLVGRGGDERLEHDRLAGAHGTTIRTRAEGRGRDASNHMIAGTVMVSQ